MLYTMPCYIEPVYSGIRLYFTYGNILHHFMCCFKKNVHKGFIHVKLIINFCQCVTISGFVYGIFVRNASSNLTKSRLFTTYFAIEPSFLSFAQSTAVILPCSVQNFKMIGRLKGVKWRNKIVQDLRSRRVLDRCPTLQSPCVPPPFQNFYMISKYGICFWEIMPASWIVL